MRRVEELIGAPVALLSTSPDRDDTIMVQRSVCRPATAWFKGPCALTQSRRGADRLLHIGWARAHRIRPAIFLRQAAGDGGGQGAAGAMGMARLLARRLERQ